MMNLVRHILRGWGQALRMPGLITLLYTLNICVAAILVLPFTWIFQENYRGTGVSYEMFEEVPVYTFVEFQELYADSLGEAALFTAPAFLFMILIHFMVTGGIIQRLSEPRRMPWGAFAACSVGRVPALLFIELVSLILLAITVALPYWGMTELISSMDENAVTPWPALLLSWARAALAIFMLAWTLATRDCMRVALVAGATRSAWRATGFGLRMMTLRFFPGMVLWVAFVAVAWVIAAGFAAGSSAVMQETWPHLIGAFALAQVAVLVRVIGGLGRLASIYAWLEDAQPPLAPIVDAEPMPGNPFYADGVQPE